MQPDLIAIVFTLAVLIVSVIIHEVAHGYAANMLGDPTAKLSGRLTLNPISHIDPIGSIVVPALLLMTPGGMLFGWAKPVPYNPYNLRNQRWGEAMVAAAGSLTNLFIALAFGLLARYGAGFLPDPFIALSLSVTLVNLYLGVFNLIPVPPLDGYATLRGLMPYRLSEPLREFEERMRSGGIATLILVLFAFSYFLAGPFASLVAFLFRALVGA